MFSKLIIVVFIVHRRHIGHIGCGCVSLPLNTLPRYGYRLARTGYHFTGWATNTTGAAVYTNSQSVKNLTTANSATVTLYALWAPAAPGKVKAVSASSTSIKISWAAVTGANGYEISRSASATSGFLPVTSVTGTTSFVNTALSTGKVYYYRVRAYHLSGQNKIYGSYSVVVSAKPVKG
jgi:uncharacterized repeat protein (TIGR02543 family)